nr:hypothetical protein [uncultured Cohaesibacter sp.]
MGTLIELQSIKLHGAITKIYPPKYIEVSNNIALTYSLDIADKKDAENLKKDAVNLQKMRDNARPIFLKVASDLGHLLKTLDEGVSKGVVSQQKAQSKWNSEVESIAKSAETALQRIANDILTKRAKVQKEAKAFRFKAVVKITTATIKVVKGAIEVVGAATATVASHGAGIPVLLQALHGAYTDVVNLSKTVSEIYSKIEVDQSKLEKDIKDLQSEYKDFSKSQIDKAELKKVFIKHIFNKKRKTISSIEENLKKFEEKMSNLKVRTSESGIKLNSIIDKQEKILKKVGYFEKELKSVKEESKEYENLKEKTSQLNKVLDASAKAVNNLLRSIPTDYKRIEAAEKKLDSELGPAVKDLSKNGSKWIKLVDGTISLTKVAISSDMESVKDVIKLTMEAKKQFEVAQKELEKTAKAKA